MGGVGEFSLTQLVCQSPGHWWHLAIGPVVWFVGMLGFGAMSGPNYDCLPTWHAAPTGGIPDRLKPVFNGCQGFERGREGVSVLSCA